MAKVITFDSRLKAVLMVILLTISPSAKAGKLADLFNQFASLECTQETDATSQFKEQFGAESGKLITPSSNPTMMKYPMEFTKFHKSLPTSMRLNKGELENGEPEIFFSQSNPSSKAEVIIIMYGENGINAISFLLLPPKIGVQFKQDAIESVGK